MRFVFDIIMLTLWEVESNTMMDGIHAAWDFLTRQVAFQNGARCDRAISIEMSKHQAMDANYQFFMALQGCKNRYANERIARTSRS